MCTWLINNQLHSSTGMCPAELFFGRPAWIPELVPEPDANPTVQSWISHQLTIQQATVQRLKQLREKTLRRSNRGRSTAVYNINDYLMVHRNRFPQWPTTKLGSQWFGPYRVLQVKHSAVMIRASPKLGGEIEVQMDLLKHFPNTEDAEEDEVELETQISLQDDVNQPEEDTPVQSNEEEGMYEVESIESHKYKQGWRFLTVWKGYGLQDATWEPLRAFTHPDGCLTKAFVDYCESKGLEAPLKNAQDIASRARPRQMPTMLHFLEA